MLSEAQNSTGTPVFSVVVAVYDDWTALEQCLRCLEAQSDAPAFEVIVVDDGSEHAAPESVRQRNWRYPLTIVQQQHAGIAAARNRGLQSSKGSVVVFTDADCRFDANCLSALAVAVVNSQQHNCFQLHLTGDSSSAVGRAEELRLLTIQNQMLQPDGRIRYLNTSGFAIRRVRVGTGADLFDPVALRAEDTLLLANLMQAGELPFFVSNAVVQHVVSLSFFECLRKDVRSAWLEGRTYQIIAAKGVRMRMGHRDRFSMLVSTWKASRQNSIGRGAWLVLVARQSLQRVVTLGYWCLHARELQPRRAPA
jgi:glycosyltransferase involved in cell wall biosynthesis